MLTSQRTPILERTLSWPDGITQLVFSPDNSLLAFGDTKGRVNLCEVKTGQPVSAFMHGGNVQAVAFSPDGRWLASSTSFPPEEKELPDDDMGVLDKVKRWFAGDPEPSSNSHKIDPQRENGNVKIWDRATGACLHTLTGHGKPAGALAFSPDGRLLASGGVDKTVQLWDTAIQRYLPSLRHNAWVTSIAFSPDSQLLATAGWGDIIRLWEPHSGRCVRALEEYDEFCSGLSFSPDGQFLGNGSNDKTVRLWNVATGQCERVLHGTTKYAISGVAISPDGSLLASNACYSERIGSTNICLVQLWEVSSGRLLHNLDIDDLSAVGSLSFAPDGLRLAFGGSLKAQIWRFE